MRTRRSWLILTVLATGLLSLLGGRVAYHLTAQTSQRTPAT